MNYIYRPKYLPLNIIDRQFLIPETDDFINGPYLPMTIAAVVFPRKMPSVEAIQNAIVHVDDNFPQYRLCYKLNLITPRWVLISDADRINYLKSRVQKVEFDTLDDHLSFHVQQNLFPLDEPLKIFVSNKSLCIHLYHPLGDASFLFQFTASLVEAIYKPENVEKSDSPYSIPLNKVVMSNIPQTIKVLGHSINRINEKISKYISPRSSISRSLPDEISEYQATITGTNMRVVHVEVKPEKMTQIRSHVKNLTDEMPITLNTYWQIYFTFRMIEMGLIDWPVELTTLVNLRRYMNEPNSFYPGNCISNIRLKINEAPFTDACVDYQARLTDQVESAYPLSDIVGNWPLASASNKLFKLANRNWYMNTSPLEKRFFTLTNAGRLDNVFESIADYLLPDIRLVTPIMGAAPLVIAFTSINDYGHFTATYKPEIISLNEVLQIIDINDVNLGVD